MQAWWRIRLASTRSNVAECTKPSLFICAEKDHRFTSRAASTIGRQELKESGCAV